MSTADAAGRLPRRRPGREFHFRLSRARVLMIVGLFAAPWAVLIGRAVGTDAAPHRADAPVAIPELRPPTSPITPGAPAAQWGELSSTPILLEPPAEYAARFVGADTGAWHFADSDALRVGQVLSDAGLTAAQRDAVIRAGRAEPRVSGFVARPEPSVILSLAPAARDALYRSLAADKRNAQADPFRRPVGSGQWFSAADGLAEETVRVARQLVYRRGDAECFADVGALAAFVPSTDERTRLFRVLSRQSALLVTLRVAPGADLGALVAYWGAGGREREVAPLLESVAKLPGGRAVDVARLLPPFARSRLHTYPEPVDASANGRYDCHWTSLSFFNASLDDSLTDPAAVARKIQGEYRPIDRPSQLGDVIFVLNAAGQGIHSAAYVAGDVCFTKNGANLTAPWQLMRLPDLEAHYRVIGGARTVYFRRNDR